MILLRRLNNAVIGLNADLIERIDETPDTVITLVDGKKYIVAETPEEVVERIVAFRANVLLNVGPLAAATPPVIRSGENPSPQLRLVTDTPTDPSEPGPSPDAQSTDAQRTKAQSTDAQPHRAPRADARTGRDL